MPCRLPEFPRRKRHTTSFACSMSWSTLTTIWRRSRLFSPL
jgi:hypothetical protein